jgi:hypothetical protein
VIELLYNPAHLHILLNHIPTVGFGVALALFLVALAKNLDSLKRTGFVMFFVVANVSIATYTTGNAAEPVIVGRTVGIVVKQGSPVVTSAGAFGITDRGRVIKIGPDTSYVVTGYTNADTIVLDRPYEAASDANAAGQFVNRPGVSTAAIREHEDAALWAFGLMEITGFFAWLALWQWRGLSKLAGWNTAIVTILALLTFAAMTRAAVLGGDIHHEEVRDGQTASSAAAADTEGLGMARTVGAFVNGSSGQTWVWATCETLHFVGLCLLFTVVLLLDMRMLGMMKSVSFAALYQLLPLGMLGFGINLITGMAFFIAAPNQYVHNVTFFWKIVFVVLGGFNVLYFMLDDQPWSVKSGDEAPLGAKMWAASAIFIWVLVLFCGHMLPFIGNAF